MSRILQALKQLEAKSAERADEVAQQRPFDREQRTDLCDLTPDEVAALSAPFKRSSTSADETTFRLAAPAQCADDEADEQFDDASTPSQIEPLAGAEFLPSSSPWPSFVPAPEPTEYERSISRALDDGSFGQRYRLLADRIIANAPAGIPQSLLFITVDESPAYSDMLVRIAAAVGEGSDGKVLLVDGDFSQKTITARFKQGGCPGLAEALNRRQRCTELLVPTALKRLHLLPLGRGLLTSYDRARTRIAEVLHELKSRFRHVMIDGGSADQQAARELSRCCDATLLVVQCGRTDRHRAASAVSALRTGGARMFGCVVIDAAQTTDGV